MTIIYIHGVKVRSPVYGQMLRKPFLRWLGPKLAGADTAYEAAYWGDLVKDQFRWKLACRPVTALLGLGGADLGEALGVALTVPRTLLTASTGAVPIPDGSVLDEAPAVAESAVLDQLPSDRRADALADLYLAARSAGSEKAVAADLFTDDPRMAEIASAAADVAVRWTEITDGLIGDNAHAQALLNAVDQELKSDTLISAGGMEDWLSKAGEILRRATSVPGDLVSTAFGEARPIVSDFVANFIGDVLTYQNTRDSLDGTPGPIPQRILRALVSAHQQKEAKGERIIVVTHSMGSQIFFDAIAFYSTFVPELSGLMVDHWISCGCQVSFFAELGLLRGQSSVRAPDHLKRPRNVLRWTNYFDRNDLFGFVMRPIFGDEDVVDLEYDTGYGLALAHSGFLARPSFFETMAKAVGITHDP
jgi:hypothetical protein